MESKAHQNQNGNHKSLEENEQNCLKSLKVYIKENRDLDYFSDYLDDRFLLHYVRGCKYDSKKALKILTNYFSTRRTQPEFFRTLRPSTNVSFRNGNFRVLKYRDHLDRLIIINRTRIWDPVLVPVEDVFQLLILMAEEIWNCEWAEKNGVVIIFDLAGWTLAQSTACTPKHVFTGFNLLWNNMPLRYKGMHVVNENFLFNILFKGVKLFLPSKLRQRFHTHSRNLNSLHDKISPDILPESLGGNLPEEEAYDDDFDARIRAKEEFYEKFAQKICSEPK